MTSHLSRITTFTSALALLLSLIAGCAGPQSDDITQARRTVDEFMRGRMRRDRTVAESYLSEYARMQYGQDSLALFGATNPYFARYDIVDASQLDADRVEVTVRIFRRPIDSDDYTGSFDEHLVLVKRSDGRYVVDSMEIDHPEST